MNENKPTGDERPKILIISPDQETLLDPHVLEQVRKEVQVLASFEDIPPGDADIISVLDLGAPDIEKLLAMRTAFDARLKTLEAVTYKQVRTNPIERLPSKDKPYRNWNSSAAGNFPDSREAQRRKRQLDRIAAKVKK